MTSLKVSMGPNQTLREVYGVSKHISVPTTTGCFKKSFTTLKAYRNLYRGHTQGFELSKCSKTHRVLPRIVMVQYCQYIQYM